jgi:hypothetical protein
MKLVHIVLTAVVSDEDAALDRLEEGEQGCPLNLLPRLVDEATDWGTHNGLCPFCTGRAWATVLREATPEDVERFTWNTVEVASGMAP